MYVIRKVRNKNCFSVKNIKTGVFHAKCATKENAKKQVRLLNAMDHGWKPRNKNNKSPIYVIRKKKNKDAYTVKNKITGVYHSRDATKENAIKQVRLLNALQYGWKPSKKNQRKKDL